MTVATVFWVFEFPAALFRRFKYRLRYAAVVFERKLRGVSFCLLLVILESFLFRKHKYTTTTFIVSIQYVTFVQ